MEKIQQIKALIDSAISSGENGKYSACRKDLSQIYHTIKEKPFLLWEDAFISQLGKSIILMIHLDLIDDEDQNIGLAHLAYLYITKGFLREQNMQPEPDSCELFRILKDRIILLKSFDDFFIESLISFYYAKQKAANQEEYNNQRKAVLSRMPLMQFADIHLIEQDYPNLRDDEFLLELTNYIEHDGEIGTEEIKEALLLHQILFKISLQKAKEGKLCY